MKILLAYDGFTHSENALATAADLGHAQKAEITILSVVPPDARGSKSGGQTAGAEPESSLKVIEAPGPVVHVTHDEERRPRAEDLQGSNGRVGVEVGGHGHCHSVADLRQR